jgi:hypothetical protein
VSASANAAASKGHPLCRLSSCLIPTYHEVRLHDSRLTLRALSPFYFAAWWQHEKTGCELRVKHECDPTFRISRLGS